MPRYPYPTEIMFGVKESLTINRSQLAGFELMQTCRGKNRLMDDKYKKRFHFVVAGKQALTIKEVTQGKDAVKKYSYTILI